MLRTTAPDPNFIGSEFDIDAESTCRGSDLFTSYRTLQPRSASDSGGTPSGVQGAEPLGLFQVAAPRLVLASASATRRALLTAAGLRFDTTTPAIDESAIKFATRSGGGTAEQAALALASMKAATVTDPDALAIGCDQILVCGTTWFDKPPNLEVARHQLHSLRGRSHTLVTAVACHRGGQRLWRHVESPRLTMREFSGAFLDAYMAAEGAAMLGSVGAYRLEGLGVQLFATIEGEHATILGLPLTKLLGFLRQNAILLA